MQSATQLLRTAGKPILIAPGTEPAILKSKTAKKLFMIKIENGLDIKDERQK